jgi:HK97 family phage major capsid protein
MENLKEFQAALDAKLAEQKAAVEAATEKASKAFEDRVSEINEKMVKTNKSLEEARQEVLDAKAALGKIQSQESKKVASSYSDSVAEMKSAIGELIVKNYDAIKEAARPQGKQFAAMFDTKAVGVMTEAANLTGSAYVSYQDNPFMRSFVNPHLRSVFGIIPVSTGSVSFPRGNTPVGEGSVAKQTTEGAAKAQLDYDVTMVNVPLYYIAGYAKISRQMIDDLPFMQSYLQTSLIEDFQKQENTYYLNAIASSATAGSTSATATAEKFIDYVVQLGAANWNANLILTTHAGWANVLKTLPSGGSYSVPGGLTVDNNGNVRIMGIPVVPHSQVTAGKAYVMDTSKYKIAQQSGLAVRSSESNEDDFIKNILAFRVEARCELLQYQPTAAIYGNI